MKKIIKLITNKDIKIILFYNYHRVEKINKNNKYQKLSYVTPLKFKLQIIFFKIFFNIVNIKDVIEFKNLKKINIVITFDDVSKSIYNIKNFLIENDIPFSICLNISTILNNSIREKVYILNNFLSKDTIDGIFNKETNLKYKNYIKNNSFIKYSKNLNINQYKLIKIIDKIYNNYLSIDQKNIINTSRYLSIQDVKENFIHKNITIVNHGYNHINYKFLSIDQINQEIDKSTRYFEKNLDKKINIFALPYGEINMDTLFDLNIILKKYGYIAALWTGYGSLSINKKYQNNIIHIKRQNDTNNIILFYYRFFKNIINVYNNFNNLKSNNSYRKPKFVINTNKDDFKAFENIVRQTKDYATSDAYLNYLFDLNPFFQNKFYFNSLMIDYRVKFASYEFFVEFIFNSKAQKGIYISSWRKSPDVNFFGIELILKSISSYNYVGIYRPPKHTLKIYQTLKLKEIKVYEIILKNKFFKKNKETFNKIIFMDKYDKKKFFENNNYAYKRKNIFTINRSYKFLSWRIDNHSKSEFDYLFFNVLDKKEDHYLIIKKGNNYVSIIDFSIFNEILFDEIFQYIFIKYKVSKIKIMTSNEKILDVSSKKYNIIVNSFYNFYKISDKQKYKKIKFHETYLTSDIYNF